MAAREIVYNNDMDKNKKTLTISSNLKKIDMSSISSSGKRSFSVEKRNL